MIIIARKSWTILSVSEKENCQLIRYEFKYEKMADQHFRKTDNVYCEVIEQIKVWAVYNDFLFLAR